MSTSTAREDRQSTGISELNYDEVLMLFDRYGFRDAHGHDLIHCQDFIDLVEQAIKERYSEDT